MPSSVSSRWKWLIIRIPLRAAIPKTARKPTSEPSESSRPPSQTASTPADQRHRQQQEGQQRQPEAAERRLQQEQDRHHGREPEEQQLVLRGLQLGGLAEDLGVVAQREADASASRSSTSLDDRARSRPSTLAPTSIRRDCFSRSIAFGVGAIRTSATSLELDPLARRGVELAGSRRRSRCRGRCGMAVTCTS